MKVGSVLALSTVLALVGACSATMEEVGSSRSALPSNSRWTNGCLDDNPTKLCPGCYLPDDVKTWWSNKGGLRLFGFLIESGPRVTLNDDGSVAEEGRLFDTWVFERYIVQRKPGGLQGMLVGAIRFRQRAVGPSDDPTDSKDPGFLSEFTESNCSGETYGDKPLAHPIRGAFCHFFQHQGRVADVGLPVTDLRREDGKLVQYFERMRLEWASRPGVAPASVHLSEPGVRPEGPSLPIALCDYRVGLGLLGSELAEFLREQTYGKKKQNEEQCASDADCKSGVCEYDPRVKDATGASRKVCKRVRCGCLGARLEDSFHLDVVGLCTDDTPGVTYCGPSQAHRPCAATHTQWNQHYMVWSERDQGCVDTILPLIECFAGPPPRKRPDATGRSCLSGYPSYREEEAMFPCHGGTKLSGAYVEGTEDPPPPNCR